MCLWSVFFALVLNEESRMLGWLEWWWLGGIYSPNHYSSRWLTSLSKGTPTVWWCTGHSIVHCSVCATSADSWGLELLIVENFCPFGAPDSPVRPDVADCLLTSDASNCGRSPAVDRCSEGSPDIAHRTVR
jgi:hypothetical protein